MEKFSIWNNHTPKIKKLLEQHYPSEIFRLKTDNYSGGKSVNIWTSLLKKSECSDAVWRVHANANPSQTDHEAYREHVKVCDANKVKEWEIKKLLTDFWSIDYDNVSGEILAGANAFIFIEPLEDYPY